MPSFNRRGFLQLLGAAGMAPLLPALPTRAVAATPSGSVSKALWSGIYAKSGSVPKFAKVAQSMGLPNAAIQGVGARSVGVRVVLASVSQPVARTAVAGNATLGGSMPLQTEPSNLARTIQPMTERSRTDEMQDVSVVSDLEAETSAPADQPQSEVE